MPRSVPPLSIMLLLPILPWMCMLLAPSAHAADPPAPANVTEIRAGLEQRFRSQTGLGFSEFACDLPPGGNVRTVPEFRCDARDDEGEQFQFRIWRDGEQQNVSMWQPVAQLAQAPLARLLEPVSTFFQRFGAAQWEALHGDLDVSLKEQLDLDAAIAMLSPMRQRFGDIKSAEPQLYNEPGPGQQMLEYAVETTQGPVSARFQLVRDQAGAPRIAGFVLYPRPDSALAGQMLGESAAAALAPQLGPIRGVELPHADLRRIGDVVEGTVVLESGEEISVAAAQISTSTDFRTNDYRFAVLEVSWMIRRHLAQQGDTEATVTCPQRSAVDGGSVVCTVTAKDGSVQRMEVLRQGGGHRLRVVEPAAD